MNDYIAFSAYFGVALTLLVYLFACRMGKRLHHPLANPMLLCLIMMIALLLLLDIDYDAYNQSARYLTYLLTPATACLALPLYRQIKKLREYSVDSQISALNEQAAAFENDKRRYTEILASLEEYVSKRTELLAEELKMPNVSITLFEPVKTTGELKSVFRFAYKGRNYAALSLSERTAAGLEICALMRRLTGLNFPVFIDNTESVAHFDMSSLTCQTVFLRMVKNTPLSVKSMNQATEPLKKAS